jgi:effector-binding domain-containing protein
MSAYEVHAQTLEEQTTAVCLSTLHVSEIPGWLGSTFGEVAGTAAVQGCSLVGPPFARYRLLEDEAAGAERFEVEAGFPTSQPVVPDGNVRPSSLPGGPAAVTSHFGPYDGMRPAYEAVIEWVGTAGGHCTGAPWEVYLSDPGENPDPSTWRTDVVQPYTA